MVSSIVCRISGLRHTGGGFQPPRVQLADTPATTYVVSVFEMPSWRAVLTTKDKQKSFDMAKEIGDKVRIEEITPKVK